MAITAMKVDYPEPKEFPTNNITLQEAWQIDLILNHLPEPYSESVEVDYTGTYDPDYIEQALEEIREELEDDPEGTHIISRIKEYEPNTVVTIDDIKRLCDWLQVCVDKGYVIYVD